MAVFVDENNADKISERISKLGYKKFVIGELTKKNSTDSVVYF